MFQHVDNVCGARLIDGVIFAALSHIHVINVNKTSNFQRIYTRGMNAVAVQEGFPISFAATAMAANYLLFSVLMNHIPISADGVMKSVSIHQHSLLLSDYHGI